MYLNVLFYFYFQLILEMLETCKCDEVKICVMETYFFRKFIFGQMTLMLLFVNKLRCGYICIYTYICIQYTYRNRAVNSI